ncbi:MAG: hypothetical protein JWM98_2252, partial [Thermoleophilia bacterium]|nr:hypothetical protein [Thermoleophilia bacterium]
MQAVPIHRRPAAAVAVAAAAAVLTQPA